MSKYLKVGVRAFCFATFVVMTLSLLYLWFEFASRSAGVSNNDVSATYPFSVKGRIVYVTGTEANQYTACWIIALTCFIIVVLLGPKRVRFPRSVEERIQWKLQGISELEAAPIWNIGQPVFFATIVVITALSWFFGHVLCELVATHLGVLNL